MSLDLFEVLTLDKVTLSDQTNTGWVDVADTYATVGAPNADQVSGSIDTIRDAGVYEVGLSSTYNINSTGNSAQIQFRMNGGAWESFSRESKDSSDRVSLDYMFPFTHTGGTFTMDVQMKKENNTNTMHVYFLNMWFRRIN